jgi:predicted enzyme related to lactoylglutathione lyase
MVTKTVVHFEIPADDVEKLSKFYSDVFGWKFDKSPPMGGMEYWMIGTGPRNRSVGGGMYKKNGMEDRPRNYIAVDKIDAAIGAFTTAGGKEIVAKQEVPGFGWSYLGSDPEGNVVGLFETATRRQRHKAKRSTRRAARRS